MRIGRLFPYGGRDCAPYKHKSPFKGLSTGKGSIYTTESLDGSPVYRFNWNLPVLYSRVMVDGNIHILSIEQERLLKRYLEGGGEITPDDLTELDDWVYDYDLLTNEISQLDEFLGSYLGEKCYGKF